MIDALHRHRQQLAVIDLFGLRADQVHQHLAPAGDCHDVPRLNHGVCRRIHDLVATSNTLNEHSLVRKQRLRLLRGLADSLPSRPDAECAQFEFAPGCARAAQFFLAAVLLFVAFAGGLKIDAEQGRAEQGKNNRGSDRAEDVGDSVSHRHPIQELLGFFGRQAKAVDRIGRKAHRRRDRLRTCIKTRGGAHVIAGH